MPAAGQKLFQRLTGPEPGPCWLSGLRGLARVASWGYGLGVQFNNCAFDLGLKRVRCLPVPVVGVGNLSVGGTGKTPLTMAVVSSLQRLGLKAAIISRGYGGRAQRGVTWVSRGSGLLADAQTAGDEPVVMARRLPVPVAVGPDRYQVGREVVAACGPMVLVGDDLFQHRRLHRDLDLVALDVSDPAGLGALLPRGKLREPEAALRRAKAVVLTHAGDQRLRHNARSWLRRFWGPGPVLSCRHKILGLTSDNGRRLEPQEVRGRPVLAFCGLARPESFAQSLRALGLEILELVSFNDHHYFKPQELEDLMSRALKLGAQTLVCTEKDEVRLPPLPPGATLWVTRLALDFDGGEGALDDVLAWGLKDWGKIG
ncbi:MAG: tetraacyldisaccharide 4'-kinase [Desulfarculaceae bacterium]